MILFLTCALLAAHAGPGLAQDAFPARAGSDGAFERSHAEAARLLDAFGAGRSLVLEELAAGGMARLETETYARLADGVDGSGREGSTAGFEGLDPRVGVIVTRARALQRRILDVYADDGVADRHAAAEAAIDAYLASPGVALSPVPKALAVTAVLADADAAGEHAGHDMPAMQHAGHDMAMADAGFWGGAHPKVAGALRAQTWLENALFEPLLVYGTAEERRAGVAEVVSRFRAKFQDAPTNFPLEMPTTAAIAPELGTLHPRAAVILNHLHMLEETVVDVVAAGLPAAERDAAIARAIQSFTDPDLLAVSDYEWLLQSLRPGIFSQGGPAIGTMDRPDRNQTGGHGSHGVMPGMSAPGGM